MFHRGIFAKRQTQGVVRTSHRGIFARVLLLTLAFFAGTVHAQTFTFDGKEYDTVTSPVTNRVWLDRNLGADRVATSKTDEQSFGGLYQYGRATDGHQRRSSDALHWSDSRTPVAGLVVPSDIQAFFINVPNNFANTAWTSNSDDLIALSPNYWNICPAGYRVPNRLEWDAETALTSSDAAFASFLKLPAGGDRYVIDGTIRSIGTGFYWGHRDRVRFTGNRSWSNTPTLAFGISVRCIDDADNRILTRAQTFTVDAIDHMMAPENEALTFSTSTTGDEPLGTLIYTFTGDDADEFSGSGNTVVFAAQDYEDPADSDADNIYEVTLTAKDVYGNPAVAATQAVVITVTNREPTLTGITFSAASVVEGSAHEYDLVINSVIGGTAQGAITFTVSGGADRELFSLDGNVLTLPAQDYEVPLDSNIDNVYEVTIEATDAEGPTVSDTVSVTVTDGYDVVRNIMFGGKTYHEVVSPRTNRIWLDRNIGADQVATSAGDEDSYGYLVQWGRGLDGHQLRTAGLTVSIGNNLAPTHGLFINSNADWTADDSDESLRIANWSSQVCPVNYRVPSEADYSAENIANAGDGFNSALKLTAAGERHRQSGNVGGGGTGNYWVSDDDRRWQFRGGDSRVGGATRSFGMSIRCIRDPSYVRADVSPDFTVDAVASATVAENTAHTFTVTTSGDTPLGTLGFYALSGDGAGDISGSGSAGAAVEVIFAAQDYENPTDSDRDNTYNINLTAVDSYGNQATRALAISVSDTAAAAFAVSFAAGETTESVDYRYGLVANGTITGDRSGTLTYTLTGGADQALFGLDGNVLTLAAQDFEALTVTHGNPPILEAQVTITDVEQGTAASTVSVTVTDVEPELVRDISFGGKIYNEVISPTTGRVWLDRNTGADQVATSVTDADGLGYLVQWGRLLDGHESRTSGETGQRTPYLVPGHGDFIATNSAPPRSGGAGDWSSYARDLGGSTDERNTLRIQYWSSQACPPGYRIPDGELQAEGFGNINEAFNSFLKLPGAGERNQANGNVQNVGQGFYWQRDQNQRHRLHNSGQSVNLEHFSKGLSVRCYKDAGVSGLPVRNFTVNEIADASIVENATHMFAVNTTGSLFGNVRQYRFGGDNASDFSISGNMASFTAPDYDDAGTNVYTSTVTVLDIYANQASRAVTFTVTDATVVAITFTVTDTSVGEGAVAFYDLTANGTIAPTSLAPISYDIAGGDDEARFFVDNNMLALYAQDFESPADSDRDNAYQVTVRATDVHGNRASASVTFTVTDRTDIAWQGLTYFDVTSSTTSEVWLDRNIGARRVPISKVDTLGFGHHIQWGRGLDGHEIYKTDSTGERSGNLAPTHELFINSGNDDWSTDDSGETLRVANWSSQVCPVGYAVPTEAQWTAESLSSSDAAFASELAIPASGERHRSGGDIRNAGNAGNYWVRGDNRRIQFGNGSVGGASPAFGMSVRCIKDSSYTPPTTLSATFTLGAISDMTLGDNVMHTIPATTSGDTPLGTLGFYALSGDGADAISGSGTDVIFAAPDHNNPTDSNGDNVYNITLTALDSYGNSASQDFVITVSNQGAAYDVPTPFVVVEEGTTSPSYSVVLIVQPSADVTITPAATNLSNSGAVTFSPTALTFTSSDWSTRQTVAVSAADDADSVDGRFTIEHTVSPASLGDDFTRNVSVLVGDNDRAVFSISPASVAELAGATIISLSATLSAPRPAATAIALASSGTAVDGTDYATVTLPTTINVPAGDTTASVTFSLDPSVDSDSDGETIVFTPTATGVTISPTEAQVTIIDGSITIGTTALTLSEDGGTASYSISISPAPSAADVVITPASDNPDLSFRPTSLMFAIGEGGPQDVEVTARADDDASVDTAIITHRVASDDENYRNALVSEVGVTINDTSVARVNIVATTQLSVPEGGFSTYSVVLDTDPLSENPTFTISPVANAEDTVRVNPSALIFTSETWNTPRTIAVYADEDADGLEATPPAVTFSHAIANYSGAPTDLPDIIATVRENDIPALIASERRIRIEPGDTGTYTLRLATDPTLAVTVTPASTDNDDIIISPSQLQFTAGDGGNWAVAQTITVEVPIEALLNATITHGVTGYTDSDGSTPLTRTPTVHIGGGGLIHSQRAGMLATSQQLGLSLGHLRARLRTSLAARTAGGTAGLASPANSDDSKGLSNNAGQFLTLLRHLDDGDGHLTRDDIKRMMQGLSLELSDDGNAGHGNWALWVRGGIAAHQADSADDMDRDVQYDGSTQVLTLGWDRLFSSDKPKRLGAFVSMANTDVDISGDGDSGLAGIEERMTLLAPYMAWYGDDAHGGPAVWASFGVGQGQQRQLPDSGTPQVADTELYFLAGGFEKRTTLQSWRAETEWGGSGWTASRKTGATVDIEESSSSQTRLSGRITLGRVYERDSGRIKPYIGAALYLLQGDTINEEDSTAVDLLGGVRSRGAGWSWNVESYSRHGLNKQTSHALSAGVDIHPQQSKGGGGGSALAPTLQLRIGGRGGDSNGGISNSNAALPSPSGSDDPFSGNALGLSDVPSGYQMSAGWDIRTTVWGVAGVLRPSLGVRGDLGGNLGDALGVVSADESAGQGGANFNHIAAGLAWDSSVRAASHAQLHVALGVESNRNDNAPDGHSEAVKALLRLRF